MQRHKRLRRREYKTLQNSCQWWSKFFIYGARCHQGAAISPAAGRHPSRFIRFEPLPRWLCGYRSGGQDNEHIWSLRDTNKSFRHWILVAQQRTALPSRSSVPVPKPATYVSCSATHDLRVWTANVVFSGLLEVNSPAIWRWNVSAAALTATFKVWSECSNGVCLPAPWNSVKKNHPHVPTHAGLRRGQLPSQIQKETQILDVALF